MATTADSPSIERVRPRRGLRALWSGKGHEPESLLNYSNQLALTEIVQKYDVVEVVPSGHGHEPYILVAERDSSKQLKAKTESVSFAELGSASPSPFTSSIREEYNPKLRGAMGLRMYDQMRRQDGTIGGMLRLIKTPVLGARWFVEPASDDKRDQDIADFVWKALTEYQSISWTQLLTEALLMMEFGYYMFEKVYDVRVIKGQPRIVWQKLAPRHPMDVKKWHKDSTGGPRSVEMHGEMTDPFYVGDSDVKIPIDKLLVFSFQREAGNIEGMSLLRTAHKHWYYKDQLYKIDAIQKERHGIGVPVIKLPMGFTPKDRDAANELGRNLRTNERAHVVLPPNWELIFAKLEGQPVNAMESIEHHDARIRENIIAKFLGDKVSTRDEDQYMFLKASRHIADLISDTFNTYAIKQLVDFNFQRLPNGYPRLRARNIGEDEDQRTFSFSLRNLVGAGIITPDEKLEEYVRDFMDLPPADPDTRREIAQPQNPNDPGNEEEENPRSRSGRAGLPRQQLPGGGARPGPFGLPRSNGGTDRSGG